MFLHAPLLVLFLAILLRARLALLGFPGMPGLVADTAGGYLGLVPHCQCATLPMSPDYVAHELMVNIEFMDIHASSNFCKMVPTQVQD